MRVRLPLVVARIRWTAYLGIWLARFLGLVRRALSGEVRLGLILTAIIATALWRLGQLWWLAIVGFAVVMILIWGYRARKRLVIEPVSDFTARPDPAENADSNERKRKDKKLKAATPDAGAGLATRLAAELTYLTAVHRQVDERRVIRTSVEPGHTVQPYAKVDDVSAFLADATGAEGQVTFGPFQVPLGLLLGLLGKIVRGPRIVASIHEEAGHCQLIASMSGGGSESRTWRVSDVRPGPSGSDGARPLDEMLTELACRIFADLSRDGLRWEATLHFSRGLSAYRDALNSSANRVLNLKTAEREFIEARAADARHGLASYNLGVVYTELCAITGSPTVGRDRASAATWAFQKAIDEGPERWEPFYARAEQAYLRRQHQSVVRYCDRVIALAPETARSYDLKAMALEKIPEAKAAAMHCHNLAVYNAWRYLMRYEITYSGRHEPKVEDMKATTQQCLLRLGQARLDRASHSSRLRRRYLRRSAGAAFRQARWIDRHTVAPYLSLADLHDGAGDNKGVEKELEAAAERAPLDLSIRASLALAKARIKKTDGAAIDCTRVLDSPTDVIGHAPGALEKLADAYDILGEPTRAAHVRDIRTFWDRARQLRSKRIPDVDGLDEIRSNYTEDHEAWNRGYVDYLVGLVNMRPQNDEPNAPPRDPEEAARRFARAIDEFKDDHQQETRTLGLHAQRARALAHAGHKRDALMEAEKGIALDPLNAFERRILGSIYYTHLGAYDEACSSFGQALLSANDDPEIHRRVGLCHLKLADERHALADKRRELDHAAAHFRHALELFSERERRDHQFSTYFNLARTEMRLGAYGKAISHFKVARAADDARLIATLKLAESYLRNGAFTDAVATAKSVTDEIDELADNGGPAPARYGASLDYEMSLEAIRVRAKWCWAHAFAERGSRLKKALAEIRSMDFEGLTTHERPEIEAACLDCIGWILTQQAQHDEAITVLKKAIALDSTADSHYHLACAYAHLAETAAPSDRHRVLRLARESARRAAALDIEDALDEATTTLLQRIEALDGRVVEPEVEPVGA
jgi:tetratricopeptide (TPR) repeat protein